MAAEQPVSMLHVFPAFQYGGQQTRLSEIIRGSGPGFHHRIISLSEDISASALLDGISNAEIESLEARKSTFISFSTIHRLVLKIRQTQPCVLCTYNWGALEAAIANRLGPSAPHIHFEDGFGPDESIDVQKTRRVWARRLILLDSVVVVPSKTLLGVALEHWRLNEKSVRRIPNGIDLLRFSTQRLVRREGEGVVIGTVGALRKEKNYGRLIQAFARLDRPAFKLEIAGDGPEREHLKSLAASAGVGASVRFSGYTAAPEQAYESFDVFALSSDTEQMPISLMEAMAAGLPVIATDVGDIKEMVSDENRQFIIALGDETAYLKALRHLCDDSALRARMGAANARKAAECFSLEKMIDAHEDLYRAMFSKAR